MKILYKFADIANRILMIATGLLAAVLMTYGLYVLYDIYYTGESAYISKDLLQYRPKIVTEDDELTGKEALAPLTEINPDTVGWVEIFGTNINYPVVQGRNDLEYLNKDIFGNTTITGSIYLAADNSGNFGDWYNVIYGHHMDNGAMFGDIDKYLNEQYFRSHSKGILQTQDGDWEITIFACVSTNSYEGTVYRIRDDADIAYPALRDYINEHSYQQDSVPDDYTDDMKILGFSTCTDAVTNGRIVLFANAVPLEAEHAEGIRQEVENEAKAAKKTKKLHLIATGTYYDSRHWAVLNLICVILTLATAFPIMALRRKFRQIRYSKKSAERLDDELSEELTQELPDKLNEKQNQDELPEGQRHENIELTEEQKETKKMIRRLRRFFHRMHIGIILEILIFILSVIVFVLTENITKPMTLRDKYTGWMILIAAFALLVDFICFRYRGKRPDTEEDHTAGDEADAVAPNEVP